MLRLIIFLPIFCLTLSASIIRIQQPLIIEYEVFKEASNICGGSDYTHIECLVKVLKPFNRNLYTKYSGSNGKYSIIFYAIRELNQKELDEESKKLTNNKIKYKNLKTNIKEINSELISLENKKYKITFPINVTNKQCVFSDAYGNKQLVELTGNGFHYLLEYHFNVSSNKYYLSCSMSHSNNVLVNSSENITVIPYNFSLAINDENLNIITSNHETNVHENVQLKADKYQLMLTATARKVSGEVDIGFSEAINFNIIFKPDELGICSYPNVASKVELNKFNLGIFNSPSLVEFLDVGSGNIEFIMSHNLDANDRFRGKCLESSPNEKDINNVGKIICSKNISVNKKANIIPHSFAINALNRGNQMYYNQHTYSAGIPSLPNLDMELYALNYLGQVTRNFSSSCYAKDISIGILSKDKDNLVFIHQNVPDSLIYKDEFNDGIAKISRKISSIGFNNKTLTPLDLFNSHVINMSTLSFKINDLNTGYSYLIQPHISGDLWLSLLRGRIVLHDSFTTNDALIANPVISYEFYCKPPNCNILDIENAMGTQARIAKSNDIYWYINSMHPSNIKVEEENIELPSNLKVYSTGTIHNGLQILAIQSEHSGKFPIKINQSYGYSDFALFLYYSKSYENIRDDLGVSATLEF